MNKKFDAVSKEAERKCISEVIARIEEMDGSDAGIIAAQDIIDIVTTNMGPEIYNMAILDAKKLIQDHVSDLETEIDLLEQKD